jgi:hypothetical protein
MCKISREEKERNEELKFLLPNHESKVSLILLKVGFRFMRHIILTIFILFISNNVIASTRCLVGKKLRYLIYTLM